MSLIWWWTSSSCFFTTYLKGTRLSCGAGTSGIIRCAGLNKFNNLKFPIVFVTLPTRRVLGAFTGPGSHLDVWFIQSQVSSLHPIDPRLARVSWFSRSWRWVSRFLKFGAYKIQLISIASWGAACSCGGTSSSDSVHRIALCQHEVSVSSMCEIIHWTDTIRGEQLCIAFNTPTRGSETRV